MSIPNEQIWDEAWVSAAQKSSPVMLMLLVPPSLFERQDVREQLAISENRELTYFLPNRKKKTAMASTWLSLGAALWRPFSSWVRPLNDKANVWGFLFCFVALRFIYLLIWLKKIHRAQYFKGMQKETSLSPILIVITWQVEKEIQRTEHNHWPVVYLGGMELWGSFLL